MMSKDSSHPDQDTVSLANYDIKLKRSSVDLCDRSSASHQDETSTIKINQQINSFTAMNTADQLRKQLCQSDWGSNLIFRLFLNDSDQSKLLDVITTSWSP